MGIDVIDLQFRMEKRFGIRIDQDEYIYFQTPGQITCLITEKLKGCSPAIPDYSATWQPIWKAIKSLPGYRRRWFWFPTVNLSNYIGTELRTESWEALNTALGVTLPPLEQPVGSGPPVIPDNISSFLSLMSWLVDHHPERVVWKREASRNQPPLNADQWTDEAIWQAVKSAISDGLGVDEADVIPNARMVEDLGMA